MAFCGFCNRAPFKTLCSGKILLSIARTTSPIIKKNFEDELAEAYLGFILNVGNMMNTIISKLESEKTLAIELRVFIIMQSLRRSLKLKKEQKFYGSIALSLLKKCEDLTKVAMFKRKADVHFVRIINYLEE